MLSSVDLNVFVVLSESSREEVVPVTRKRYKPCVTLSNCPLGCYDNDGHMLNRLAEQRNIIRFTSVDKFWMYGLYPPTLRVARMTTTNEAYPRDGQRLDMDDDDVPLSRIVQNLERRRGLTPIIQPTSQGTWRPSRGSGSPTGRRAVESATQRIERSIPFLDEALQELGDGVPDRLYSVGLWDLSLALMKLSLSRDDSRWSSNAFQEHMKVLEASIAAKDKANADLEVILADKQRLVSRLKIMLSARNTENTNQVALISGLQNDLKEHKKKLQEALNC
uniref:Uncharacterized protein n=1 Tax=Cannabis sativa TaxID=3483 RepID=A0A803PCB7_CANSA